MIMEPFSNFVKMDRKIISAKRPFWRHPIFPWGWYSLTNDSPTVFKTQIIKTDGCYKPGDGGDRIYNFLKKRF